jgi:2,3-diketo-5-methylthio-1-phosphopentane phosphatase
MVAHELSALETNPKIIFFTDFDGTITQQDSNDFMFDTLGAGSIARLKGFEDVLHGRQTFRDMFRDLMDSITLPLNECIDLLSKNITLDEGFKEFYIWARNNNMPIVILSGGMEPIIRALLSHLIGEKETTSLQIISSNAGPRNGKDVNEPGGWQIVYRDSRYV